MSPRVLPSAGARSVLSAVGDLKRTRRGRASRGVGCNQFAFDGGRRCDGQDPELRAMIEAAMECLPDEVCPARRWVRTARASVDSRCCPTWFSISSEGSRGATHRAYSCVRKSQDLDPHPDRVTILVFGAVARLARKRLRCPWWKQPSSSATNDRGRYATVRWVRRRFCVETMQRQC